MQKKTNRRWILFVLVVIVILGAAGYLVVPRLIAQTAAASQSQYQTVRAEKGDLTAFIGATGAVRSNQTVDLPWQTSGIVDKVNVVKGQKVPINTTLAELKQSSLSQNLILAQSDLVSAQKALDDLLSGTTARANAQQAVVNAQKALEDAQKARQSKQYQRASQQTIDIAHANLIQARKTLRDQEKIYDANKMRNSDDVVYAAALSQLAAAQQQYDRANYNFLYVSGLPSPLEIQQADAAVAVADANLLAAKREWERVKDGPNDQDVAAARARIAAIEATLNLSSVTNPFEGTITVVNIKPGDLVSPGTVAFQLDDLAHLYVDVDVSEVDIANVSMGQPATLSFDAFQGKEFQGSVSDIASVGRNVSGSVNFAVTVEIFDPTDEVKPGMTAAANIAVSQLQNVLVVPNRAIRTQNGKRIIYLLKNGAPTQVEITLGSSSNTESEVVAGDIKVGDLIVLNPPTLPSFGPGGGPGGN